MADTGRALRLYILMSPWDILRVFDRLRIVDVLPGWSMFRARGDTALLLIDFSESAVSQRGALIARLRQIPSVRGIRSRWRCCRDSDRIRSGGCADG